MNKFFQILFLMLPTLLLAQKDTIAHLYTFGGLANDNAEDIEATSDGGYIVVGATASNSYGNTDVYLLKVDSNCGYQWSKAIGGTNNDWGYAVKQTTDKGFIIAASSDSYGNGGYDAVLIKRDSLGNYQWRKTYGGNDWDFAYDVIQTHDGGFAFCGLTFNNTAGLSDVYIVKTNNLGDTVWTKTIGGTLSDQGNSIIETADSNLVVAGLKTTISDSAQAYIVKLNFNGTLLWDSIYGGTKYETANAIIETNSGDYVLTGTSTSANTTNDKDFYELKTNKNGTKIWENIFGNVGDEESYDVVEDYLGNLIIVGNTKANGGGGKDAELFYINLSGAWMGISPTYGTTQNEGFKSFAIGKNGDFCMAGYTNSYGNGANDVFLVRVDTIFANQPTILTVFNDTIPLKINTYNKKSAILVYPIPATQFLTIAIHDFVPNSTYFFELYDLKGRKIMKKGMNTPTTKFDLSSFPKQFYLFKIYQNKSIIYTSKLIID